MLELALIAFVAIGLLAFIIWAVYLLRKHGSDEYDGPVSGMAGPAVDERDEEPKNR